MNAWPMDTPFSAADLTLQPAPVFPELYHELWWYSGGYQNEANNASAGTVFPKKGGGNSATAVPLYTFSSSWPSNTKCAFEATLWTTASTGYAELWDVTAGTAVSGSQISTTSTTSTVIRSGQFTPTPGHSYGFTIWGSSTSSTYITDASLIIFPSAPLISPSVSAISLANPSGNTLKEAYYPLWVYSSGLSGGSTATSAGSQFLQKGTTSISGSSTATTLYTLTSSWSPNQQFALESSLKCSSGSGAVNIAMWDKTANSLVSLSEITSTTASSGGPSLIRSGSFTLTPSHSYAITVWSGSSGYGPVVSKAHLVALA